MLHGKVLRSPHAHANIKSINTEKARALPGVKAVITADDWPKLSDKVEQGGEGPINLAHLSRTCSRATRFCTTVMPSPRLPRLARTLPTRPCA